MGQVVLLIVVTIIGLHLGSSFVRAAEKLNNQTALERATKLLHGWHMFRHKKSSTTKHPPKPGENCTENLNETLANLLFDRLEVSQSYYPYKDFKTRSHVAHHLHYYEENMKYPKSKTTGDFCRSRIPQDLHRYKIDEETGFSVPYAPFHFVCSGASHKCAHCMAINKTETDLFKVCHDHDLIRPEPVFKEAYALHYKIKKWFRKARMSPPQVHDHKKPCTSSLKQNLDMVKLWKLMVRKTGIDPTDEVEYAKEWDTVEKLSNSQGNFNWTKDTYNNLINNNKWKYNEWCKPRGGPGKHRLGLVCWQKKCEKCIDQEKFTIKDATETEIITEICKIQSDEDHENDDTDVESKSTQLMTLSILLIVGMTFIIT